MHIPTEILRAIIREATTVPEAFDSSLDSILHHNQESISVAIRESLLTKTALSLVSTLFHQIVEEFLYEIIVIERFHVIPHLVGLLQTWARSHSGWNKPRGHRCQRLEIHLGTGAVDYKDEAWYEGGHILWGLIPACPNVTTLLCSIWRRTRLRMLSIDIPHLTNPALWKNIASTYGPQIKRLEIYGLSIRMDRVEMMLRYCAKLEVCRLVHVRPFGGGHTYDGDEPSILKYSWVQREFCTVRDDTGGKPSGFFSEEAKRAFEKAKNTTWPPFSRRPPYELPSLHTLLIDQFNPRINKFNMPNLQFLGMYNGGNWGNEVMRDVSWTKWSKLAASLTHVSFGSLNKLPLSFFLETFPNMTELVLHHTYEIMIDAPSTITTPHRSLSVIKYSCTLQPTDMSKDIEDLLTVAQSGMLPCLRRVLITRYFTAM